MRRCAYVCLCLLLVLIACREKVGDFLDPPEREAYRNLLIQYQQRYPKAEAADFYKLIHQSVFGIKHLIRGEASARRDLQRDIFTLDTWKPG